MAPDRFIALITGRNTMRPVHIADLDMVTRHLLALPPNDWAQTAKVIVEHADLADRFRKRTGRAHPQYGSGTLASAIMRHVNAAQPARCDTLYLDALDVVVNALRTRLTHQIA